MEIAFGYTNGNTLEWRMADENIVIKMTVINEDDNLARLWFENRDGQVVGRGEYQLWCGGPDGEVAPYAVDNRGYIVDFRKNHTMMRSHNEVFTLDHQVKGLLSYLEYIYQAP